MLYLKNPLSIPRRIVLLPLITSVAIPIIITDIWIEIYHRICFPICGIKLVKRSSYVRVDRHKLKYLNLFQKIYCVYCGYGNGVIRYWTKIAGETERFWCGIQHQKTEGFQSQEHQENFAEYGDESGCKMKHMN